MDLASIFILLLNWVVRILISVPLGPEIVNSRQSCSLNFLIRHVVSWHGPLRCKTAASFRKLLNIRNIFRVAFLSCSHIRLEMCSGSLQGRSPSCLCRSVLFCATTFDMLSPNRGFVNNIFHFLFGSFFRSSQFSAAFPRRIRQEIFCCPAAVFQQRNVYYHFQNAFASTFLKFLISGQFMQNRIFV